MLNVLVVDDSKLIRSLLKEMLESAPGIHVVGEAADPYQAREKIKLLNPDVITLDVEMPKMDGITFLRNLMRLRPMPVVMLSTLTAEGAPITLEALELGAVDFLEKPKTNITDNFPLYRDKLVEKLKAAATANVGHLQSSTQNENRYNDIKTGNWQSLKFKSKHLVAIGASTGGTEALKEVITKLPSNFPPVLITQHIPPVFSATYAARLNSLSAMNVYEATEGQVIEAGSVYIAPGGQHLVVEKRGTKLVCKLLDTAPVNRHKPSVEVMFESLDKVGPKFTTVVMLTGMGADGAKSMAKLRQAGAYTIAQDEKSCVVFGMPKAAIELDAADKVLDLYKIPRALIKQAVKPE